MPLSRSSVYALTTSATVQAGQIPDLMDNNAIKLGMRPGTVDNMQKMKDAIAKCVLAGLTYLYVPAGSYNFVADGSLIVVPSNFEVFGLNMEGTEFKIDPSSYTGQAAANGNTNPFMSYDTGTNLHGFRINGQKALVNGGATTPYSQAFITPANNNVSNNKFYDLVFENMVGGSRESFGIACGHNSTKQLYERIDGRNCYGTPISINGDMAVEITNPGTALPYDIDIIDCRGTGNLWQGVTIYCAKTIRVRNFTALGNTGNGLNTEWTLNCTFTGCTSQLNGQCGAGGFGWNAGLVFDGCTIQNNNQSDQKTWGEFGYIGNIFYTASFGATGNPIRNNIRGCLQSLTILDNCTVTPKTTGSYQNHLYIEGDYASTYPNLSAIQPQRIRLPLDAAAWQSFSRPAAVYANNLNNGGSWMPSKSYAGAYTTVNEGMLLTAQGAGGFSAAVDTLGPYIANVGDTVVDNGLTWKGTALATDINAPGAPWCRNTPYLPDDIRVNNGYAYRQQGGALRVAVISGGGRGPVGQVVGATETEGGCTWYCHGRVLAGKDVFNQIGMTAFANDSWLSGVTVGGITQHLPSALEQVSAWTPNLMTVAPYTGGGGMSGHAVVLTTTGTGVFATPYPKMTAVRYLQAGRRYVMSVRYQCLQEDGAFHAAVRPYGEFNAANGSKQYDIELSCPTGTSNTGAFITAMLPFTMPATAVANPIVYSLCPVAGAKIVIDHVAFYSAREFNGTGAEVVIGGQKLFFGANPNDEDFEVGHRLLSPVGFANDQVCTQAGSFGSLGSTTTITFAAGAQSGTLSQADPRFRPGLWLNVLGSGGTNYRKILSCRGTNLMLHTAVGAAISGVVPLVVPPTFQTLAQALATTTPVAKNLTAKAGGGSVGASNLAVGYNVVKTAGANLDSFSLLNTADARVIYADNQTTFTIRIYAQSGQTITGLVSGAYASAAYFDIPANGAVEFRCADASLLNWKAVV